MVGLIVVSSAFMRADVGRYFEIIKNLEIFNNAFKEFAKWITRLAKRVQVEDVLVNISDGDKEIIMRDQDSKYRQLHDMTDDNWCEYLMWSKAKTEK